MDIKAYIESGVIESYVLGMADSQEAAELEQLSRQYPAIREAIDVFERSLEQQALRAAVTPSPTVKKALWKELGLEENEERTGAVIVPMKRGRFVAAAAIVLLVASAGLNIYYYNQLRSKSDAYEALLVEKTSLLSENQSLQTQSNALTQDMAMMNDPAMIKVSMPAVAGKEGNLATVFWDSRSKDVYLLQNKLAPAPAGKQYQLWAIVDGKPVDAGVFDPATGLARMKNIPKASMFAITLEKRGGSEQPTLTEMYVAGKVG